MKRLFFLSLIYGFFTQTAFGNHCSPELHTQEELKVLEVLTKKLNMTMEEACHSERIQGIHFAEKEFYNEGNTPELHSWITFHYNEYSCQYFLRKHDLVITRRNCYNTF